ncbi:MAG TPA: hypothetical protein VNR00_15320 [Opitutus sp.]|nr:hypothetical protein [Opitutus sp.]
MAAGMENSESRRENVLVPCGGSCRFAEPLRGDYVGWVWCHHPFASVRVRAETHECRWFSPGLAGLRDARVSADASGELHPSGLPA